MQAKRVNQRFLCALCAQCIQRINQDVELFQVPKWNRLGNNLAGNETAAGIVDILFDPVRYRSRGKLPPGRSPVRYLG